MRLRTPRQPKPTSIAATANAHPHGSDPGASPIGDSVPLVEGAVVATFTITVCAVLPLICSDELDKLQLGSSVAGGVTTQLRLTVALNVPAPARFRLKLAIWPALTVCDVGEPEAGFKVKSGAA